MYETKSENLEEKFEEKNDNFVRKINNLAEKE